MQQIFSLTQTQISQVIQQTSHYIALANDQLGLKIKDIEIRFDLKGRSSGMFVVRGKKACIRYNEMVFSKFFEDTLVNTVAHEVAHYVIHYVYGIKKVKPHGHEWKQVMAMFNVPAEVTSNYDVTDLPLNRQRQHTYECNCMTHQLSTTRHNKVQLKRAVYKCKKCKATLTFCDAVAPC